MKGVCINDKGQTLPPFLVRNEEYDLGEMVLINGQYLCYEVLDMDGYAYYWRFRVIDDESDKNFSKSQKSKPCTPEQKLLS